MVKRVLIFLGIIGAALIAAYFLRDAHFMLLEPRGTVAIEQKNLIIQSVLVMLVAVVPAFLLLFFVTWKYRADNKKSEHAPEDSSNPWFQALAWAVPVVVIALIAVINWDTSHRLDPMRPITSSSTPITIQVVSLEWKWLFIYPGEDIAAVNHLVFPEDTPIEFVLTSDAPMNSFWIPELGGQIYTMAGMSTKLHLMAEEKGEYMGRSAEISGAGFADMTFVAKAVSKEDFDSWVMSVKASSKALTYDEYQLLAEPSKNNAPVFYSWTENGLYNRVLGKYMGPAAQHME